MLNMQISDKKMLANDLASSKFVLKFYIRSYL